MGMHRSLRIVSWVLIPAAVACAARAQDYPRKPVRTVTPGPGGVSDFVMRLVANEISPAWGKLIKDLGIRVD